MGSGILAREELRDKLAELQEARETAEKELMTPEGRKEHVERLEHDRNTLMEHYAGMVPKSLDNLSPEERNQIYKMLHIEVLAYPDKSLRVSGILVGGGEAGEMALDGALPRGGLGALGLTRIPESQHTQSAGLQFRALPTEGLDDQLALLELI